MALYDEEEKREILNELEHSRVRETFDRLDDDRDGFVTLDAIKLALTEAGIEAEGELYERGLAHFRVDERGLVSWEIFARAVVILGVKLRIALYLREEFLKLDVEKTGLIRQEYLLQIIHGNEQLKEMIEDEMAINLFKEIDREAAGAIEFKVFLIRFFEVIKEKMRERELI